MENRKEHYFFLGFLCLVSLAGAGLIYWMTYAAGPGVSADGALYLSVAWNLLKGRGLVDLYGSQFTLAPPLYPALLAGLSLISSADIFRIGWALDILIFALIIFCAGRLVWALYPGRSLFAGLSSLVCATSLALINTCTSILSDPLFILLLLLFLLEAVAFVRSPGKLHLFWMGALAALACLDRYAGLSLVLSGTGFLVLYSWSSGSRAVGRSLLFLLSGLPLILWAVFFNYPSSGRLFGAYAPASLPGNSYATVEKVLYWFMPNRLIQIGTPFGWLAGLLLAAVLLNRWSSWAAWLRGLFSGARAANTILLAVYLGMLIFYTPYLETREIGVQRYHIALLVPVLVVLFAAYEQLLPPRTDAAKIKMKDRLLLAAFILWLIYPLSGIQSALLTTQARGGMTYNRYNFADIRQSVFLQTAEQLPAGTALYSNYEPAAWFYLRRDISGVPRIDLPDGKIDAGSAATFRDSLASAGGGYLIWFRTINYRDNLPSLQQLGQILPMDPVYTSPIGDIYRLPAPAP